MDFKISVEETSAVKRNIRIEIPRSIYQEKYDSAVSKTARQARIKGFRPGKAPASVISKLYGQQIHSDVLGELVNKAYQEAVESNSLRTVGYPEIDVDGERGDESDFTNIK